MGAALTPSVFGVKGRVAELLKTGLSKVRAPHHTQTSDSESRVHKSRQNKLDENLQNLLREESLEYK